MRLYYFAFLALVFAGCGGTSVLSPTDALQAAQALPPDFAYPDHDTVRVATYNVENFVDAFDNPYVDNDTENDPNPETIADKARLFAEAIRALDADVLSIQEIEGEQQLKLLADSLLSDMGYQFFASTESPNWHQNVVVMSRLPLGPLTAFSDVWTPIEGQTNDDGTLASTSLVNHRVFAVEVRARPGYTFTLVAAHLKAGRGERNEGWRLGQIDLLNAHLATLGSGANVMVAGDLNLLPDSREYARLTTTPPMDSVAVRPLPLIDPLAMRRTRTESLTFTHPSDDPSRQLDYLLVSETMLPELVANSTHVVFPLEGDDLALLSDHLPVIATILARE